MTINMIIVAIDAKTYSAIYQPLTSSYETLSFVYMNVNIFYA